MLGESPIMKRTKFCYQNKADLGIATEKEFPHTAVIQVEDLRVNKNDFMNRTSQCGGSLVSDRHVMTSFYCVSSAVNYKLSVYLGVFNLNAIDDGIRYDVDEVNVKYGVAILKLSRKVEFNEKIMPVCLSSGNDLTSPVILTGWSGDWRECDPKLKKWHIEPQSIIKTTWHLKVIESTIINYRQSLLVGSPLQIYHPDNTCQYSLVGFYEQTIVGQYTFNNLSKKLRWIESIVWPNRLVDMAVRSYAIMKNALRPRNM